jgi:heptosyltransferase-3
MIYRLLDKISEWGSATSFPVFKKILVIRPDRLGDVLLTFPAVYNIYKAFPQSDIYYLCRTYTAPIVRCYTPVKDTIIFPEEKKGDGFAHLVQTLCGLHFDLAVHLLPKASLAKATFRAGIPYRLGMGYRLYSIFYNIRQFEHRKYNDYHEAEYNLRMLKRLGISTAYDEHSYQLFNFPSSAEEAVDKIIKEEVGQQDLIVLHPGSGGSSIDWPLENFIRLIGLLAGWENIRIAVSGIQSERAWLAPLLKSGLPFIDLSGRLDLVELAVLLRKSRLFISNSTGPLHLAVAVGTPVLGFYPAAFDLGPKRWGPFMRDEKQVITPNDHLAYDLRPASNLDMTKITVENALSRIRGILDQNLI